MAIGELTTGASAGREGATRPLTSGDRRIAIALLGLGLGVALLLLLSALGAPRTVTLFGAIGLVGLGLLAKPRAATLLFVGVLYLNAPVVAVQFYGVDSVLALGAPLLLLGIPVVSYLVIHRREPVVTMALAWMVAYLVVLLVSAVVSADPEEASNSISSFATEGLVLYLLLTNAIRSWETLRMAVIVIVVAGAFLGGLSIYQEATRTYANPYGGFAQTRATDPDEQVDPRDQQRMAGPIGEDNRYAQVMLVLLPLVGWALVAARSRRSRLVAAACGVAILGGMLLTFSRGAAVSFVGLILLAVLLHFVRLRTVAIAAVALVVAVLVFAPRYIERIESLANVASLVPDESGDRPDGAILGRATSNLASLEVFMDHPILGVGPGLYVADYSQRTANELGLRSFSEGRRAHDMFLEVAADTGIFGVVTLAGIFGATLIGLWRARRTWLARDPSRAAMATGLLLAVIGYLLTALFLHMAYLRYLWLLMALANSAIWILARDARLPAGSTRSV